MATESRPSSVVLQLIGFVGFFLLLMGTYGFIRIVHVTSRGVPYPSNGVFPHLLTLPGSSIYWGRESDCNPYPQVYYTEDGTTSRPPTEDEAAVQNEIANRCTAGFDEDRSKQKQYDKNQAAFLVFVGAGLLAARRFMGILG